MLYSVYRPELKVYDYYQTSPTADDARNPPSDDVKSRQARGGRDGRDLGVSSERAGYRLPAGARRCGQGVAPKGMVVTLHPGSNTALGSLASDITFGGLATVGVLAGIGLFIWRKKLV